MKVLIGFIILLVGLGVIGAGNIILGGLLIGLGFSIAAPMPTFSKAKREKRLRDGAHPALGEIYDAIVKGDGDNITAAYWVQAVFYEHLRKELNAHCYGKTPLDK